VIELRPLAAWDKGEYDLEPATAAAINASGVVTATLIAPPARWQLEAGSSVGVLVGNDWVLRINPRMQVPQLMFLLAYSTKPEGWLGDLVTFDQAEDIVEALASGFATHAERTLEQGVLRGYVTINDRRQDFRGRIRFGDQLARSRGLPLPLEVTYDEFTADIAENRLLRTAAELLLLHRRIPARTRGRLLRIRAILDEASVLTDRRRLPMPAITPLNSRYAAALTLSRLILSSVSIASRPGGVSVTSFVFDMNEVFESFLYTALRESLARHGGAVERQAAGQLDAGSPAGLGFRADIVWRVRGQVRAVVDSKYKSLYASVGSTPTPDAYQMLAYCIGYGLPRGFLVYARDSTARTRTHVIKRHPYVIDVRAVDVEQEPAELLRDIDRLADAVAASATAPSVRPGLIEQTV
jgi:5-methylcytosine-specific restriction enzyme subunit McrC